ncbi:MAG TPA: diguanylate cyclase, partial [Gammaproteobacteria bacterium]|nr:diguanylate cyclase [Gammaproteobacteria bacterium]
MKRATKIVSIQKQYITIALLLGSFVIITSIASYLNEINRTTQLVSLVEKTTELKKSTANIRNSYSNTKRAIDAFMLEPDSVKYKKVLTTELTQVVDHIRELKADPIINTLPSATLLDHLINQTTTLGEKASELSRIRLEVNSQYPAFGLSTTIMRPSRNIIFTIINTILDETVESKKTDESHEVFKDAVESQKIWISTISEYRLYLVNKIGSFSEKSLIAQEDIIDGYLDAFENSTHKLIQYSTEGKLGFEGTELIFGLPSHLNIWRDGFREVKRIHHSDEWRQDSKLMRTAIIPLLNGISRSLDAVDDELTIVNNFNLNELNKSGSNLLFVLAIVVLLFLLYIVTSILTLRSFIIKPISMIAKSLKNEAFGVTALHSLDIKKTIETQNLIDAFREMSHQVYQRQQELEYQALNDNLTSLPNRLMLHERLGYHIKLAHREKSIFILMMLDLNHFKEVNDTLGHHVGDHLLVQVGKRLQETVRETDTVARLGGDEFAILLPGMSKKNGSTLAKKVNKAIGSPFVIHNHELHIGVSIGITEYPEDADNMHTLMQYADVAMYSAKRNKSGYSYYDPESDANSLDRLSLISDLRHAIDFNELELSYQPKYELCSGRVIGAEALLRWNHPNLGAVSPELIIDTAEKTGVINELTYWVIGRAVTECAMCHHNGLIFNVAINLSVQ